MKKLLLFLLILFSLPAYATDEAYLQCLRNFPRTITIMPPSAQGRNYLERKDVMNYEPKVLGAGYGVYYEGETALMEKGFIRKIPKQCQVSLFIYTVDPRDNPVDKKFTTDALMQHLLDYERSRNSDNKRKKTNFAKEYGAVAPDGSELIGLGGVMDVQNHEFHLITNFFDTEAERVALTEYKDHYLKALLTCSTFNDIEVDKQYMSLLTRKTLEAALNSLNQCTIRKGN